eukprot:7820925-Pyramimonas_sp.AAC.1
MIVCDCTDGDEGGGDDHGDGGSDNLGCASMARARHAVMMMTGIPGEWHTELYVHFYGVWPLRRVHIIIA